MAFCPRCGAPTSHGLSFCTACGETLAPADAPPSMPASDTTTAAISGSPPSPGGPVGKAVAPWKAIVLPIITFGVYVYLFWWRIAREIDAYAGARSSPSVRTGVLISALGLTGTLVAAITIGWPLFAEMMEDPSAAPAQVDLTDEFVRSPLYLAASALDFVGRIVLWIGLWRAWNALAEDEARRGVARRVDPRVYLGILVASAILAAIALFEPRIGLLSFAGTVATLWVMYSTQSHLNAAWIANGASPSA